MAKVTVISKKSGREYEVRSALYGTSNLIHSLYYGGIFMAASGGSSSYSNNTMEEAIAIADTRADDLGIKIQ